MAQCRVRTSSVYTLRLRWENGMDVAGFGQVAADNGYHSTITCGRTLEQCSQLLMPRISLKASHQLMWTDMRLHIYQWEMRSVNLMVVTVAMQVFDHIPRRSRPHINSLCIYAVVMSVWEIVQCLKFWNFVVDSDAFQSNTPKLIHLGKFTWCRDSRKCWCSSILTYTMSFHTIVEMFSVGSATGMTLRDADVSCIGSHSTPLSTSEFIEAFSEGVCGPVGRCWFVIVIVIYLLTLVRAVCMCVRVMLCLVFIKAVHLGNKVIFTRYHRWHHRPQYSCNATHTI